MVIHTALDARWSLLPGFSDAEPRTRPRVSETDTRDEKSASEPGLEGWVGDLRICLPRFLPSKRRRRVAGAFSSPSWMSSA